MGQSEVIQLLKEIKQVNEKLDYKDIALALNVNIITSCRILRTLVNVKEIRYLIVKNKYRDTKLYYK